MVQPPYRPEAADTIQSGGEDPPSAGAAAPDPLKLAVRIAELADVEQLRELLHHLPIAVVVADVSSGRILACNAAEAELWGLAPPYADSVEAYGRTRWGFHPDGRPYEPGEWPLVRALRTGERVEGEEIEVPTSDGGRRLLRVRAAPVRDTRGRISCWVTTSDDVTEMRSRLERERFLSRAGEILSASLDHRATVQRLAELCVESLAHYCLVHVESAGEIRALGLASSGPLAEDAVRERLRPFPVDPQDRHPIAEVLRSGEPRLLSELSPERLEDFASEPELASLLREAGLASLLVVPLRASGRTLGTITLARTGTAPPLMNDDLSLLEALAGRAALAVDNARLYGHAQESVRARENTMSIVSHDLGNSLHATLLNVDLLLEVAPVFEEGTPAWRRMVAVRRSLQHMQRLVQDLLEVDRVGRGGFVVRPERVAPQALAEEVGELFTPLAREAGVSLELRASGALPPVLADSSRVVQVLGNLLSNALHATPAGGSVVVAIEAEAEDQVRFEVSDTGSGMSAEEMARVFDRFYQGAAARRSGAGLGLPIARAIVEAHGGRIWACSRPGEGSTFAFTLPAAGGDD